MAKHNSDYIPTLTELEHMKDERLKRLEGKPDPQKIYVCKFTIEGKQFEEKVPAIDMKTAEEHLKQQWGMVGMIPRNLVTTVAEEGQVIYEDDY